MKLETLKVLSQDEIISINEATLDILENTGVKILRPATLDFLAGRGLPVDRDSQIVRMPRAVVEDALSSIPEDKRAEASRDLRRSIIRDCAVDSSVRTISRRWPRPAMRFRRREGLNLPARFS
mgnify:CR=1 FL=1